MPSNPSLVFGMSTTYACVGSESCKALEEKIVTCMVSGTSTNCSGTSTNCTFVMTSLHGNQHITRLPSNPSCVFLRGNYICPCWFRLHAKYQWKTLSPAWCRVLIRYACIGSDYMQTSEEKNVINMLCGVTSYMNRLLTKLLNIYIWHMLLFELKCQRLE